MRPGETEAVPEGAESAAAVFDPFSGISGDMVLGCWLDLGLTREWLMELADRLDLAVDVRVEEVRRAGLTAKKVDLTPRTPPGGSHSHGRHWSEIRELIEAADLPDRSRALALGAFGRLAAAEGRVHGVEPERVHFHEVGAVDAILDICGAADGFVRLGLRSASTRPVALGSGSVRIAHGTYPVPAPATAYLLEGTPVLHTDHGFETVTPTGAAILAELSGGREATGDATLERVGYGAGTRNPEDRPNCLRVWLVRHLSGPRAVVVLQTDVDDLNPEYVPGLIEACLDAGALDAVVQTIHMKKGRPGWRLEVQADPAHRDEVEDAVFRHSGTLGVRSWTVTRRTLDRSMERRRWRKHEIRVKWREGRPGSGIREAKPEYEDVAAAARAEGLAVPEAYRLLRKAWPDIR